MRATQISNRIDKISDVFIVDNLYAQSYIKNLLFENFVVTL